MQDTSQEDINTTLRRWIRMKKSVILIDYVVYLQEFEYNIKVVNDLKTFSQAMSFIESKLWYDAMKDEMNSKATNGV